MSPSPFLYLTASNPLAASGQPGSHGGFVASKADNLSVVKRVSHNRPLAA